MQKDYRKHHMEDDFTIKLRENNLSYYPEGRTGYEQYYIDIEGFWRQLYYPKEAYQEQVSKMEAKIERTRTILDDARVRDNADDIATWTAKLDALTASL